LILLFVLSRVVADLIEEPVFPVETPHPRASYT
jgi:hypothetical protein